MINQSYPTFYLLWSIFWLIQVTKDSVFLAPVYFSDPYLPFWNHNIVGYPLIPFCWQAVWWTVQSTSAILAAINIINTLWISFWKGSSNFDPNWSQSFTMTTPWCKELNQYIIKFFKCSFKIVISQMINTILDLILCWSAFSSFNLFTFDNNNFTSILSECEYNQQS